MATINREVQCGAMGLIAVGRFIRLTEVLMRLVTTVRSNHSSRRDMVAADMSIATLNFVIAAFGVAIFVDYAEKPSLDYNGAGGQCIPYVVGYFFWIGFLDFFFNLGSRVAVVARFNTFKRSRCCKSCSCCAIVYGWQIYVGVTILDIIAAFIFEGGGCHFGFALLLASPVGLFARWYAFGGADKMELAEAERMLNDLNVGAYAMEPRTTNRQEELEPGGSQAPSQDV
mmetsp:Transcript_57746/g.137420  ORF Transcript_57746/g.137420 Transcript_57746/m.137420 type:complete len:228 (-) Transcript_57746:147-830(-)|eukprot:CAMPEP_0180217818 /NCGR_PEP_ID=MMETSP0987-20121128/17228_1 /TAXON_ID=697907 /ORGANISM="non described non described, Strain CCMP2293" /LENGTH=227 /DNA_ID=CAMNT_0022177561 /DNA_START=68 /DNA_END=751 /DNA_ORIENTATION=-